MEDSREKLSSRLGFIMLSVGCAVGLGNVWRFPYVAGQNGGALFVLLYILFMVLLGIPIMTMEFSLGRASKTSIATYYKNLRNDRPAWRLGSYFAVAANYILMMFYTTIAGWTLNYLVQVNKGDLSGLTTDQVAVRFSEMINSPYQSVIWMMIVIIIGFGICVMGLQNGVEKITKYMMLSLFAILIILAIRAVTLPNAVEGIKFYLNPDFSQIRRNGISKVLGEAMAQAFFSLSVGAGGMAIFGSYIDKERTLVGEAINITLLDLLVAMLSGLIVFCACASFGVDVESGPSLVFVTMTNVFNSMAFGRIWGILFFISMCFAAMSTIIGVFENIVSFGLDLFGWSRKKSVAINMALVLILALPCALGFNVLKGIQPLGAGTNIFDLEDFIVSNNLLPLGALICVLFCTSKLGWGYDNFIEESNCGKGIKFPRRVRIYLSICIPVLIGLILVQGYINFMN